MCFSLGKKKKKEIRIGPEEKTKLLSALVDNRNNRIPGNLSVKSFNAHFYGKERERAVGPRRKMSTVTLARPAEGEKKKKTSSVWRNIRNRGVPFFLSSSSRSVNHELSPRNVTGIMWLSATSQRAHTEAFDWN